MSMMTRRPRSCASASSASASARVAEQRLDVAVVGHVVAAVGHRRRVERRDPDGVDAEVAQVRQPGPDAGQVADAVAVAVGEAADVDLVDDRAAPPVGGCGRSRRSGRSRRGGHAGILPTSGRRAVPGPRTGGGALVRGVHQAAGGHHQVVPEQLSVGVQVEARRPRRACAAARRRARPGRWRTARAASAAAGGRAARSRSRGPPQYCSRNIRNRSSAPAQVRPPGRAGAAPGPRRRPRRTRWTRRRNVSCAADGVVERRRPTPEHPRLVMVSSASEDRTRSPLRPPVVRTEGPHMATTRTANAHWEGTLFEGKGRVLARLVRARRLRRQLGRRGPRSRTG